MRILALRACLIIISCSQGTFMLLFQSVFIIVITFIFTILYYIIFTNTKKEKKIIIMKWLFSNFSITGIISAKLFNIRRTIHTNYFYKVLQQILILGKLSKIIPAIKINIFSLYLNLRSLLIYNVNIFKKAMTVSMFEIKFSDTSDSSPMTRTSA